MVSYLTSVTFSHLGLAMQNVLTSLEKQVDELAVLDATNLNQLLAANFKAMQIC